jgi:hypothetical protein
VVLNYCRGFRRDELPCTHFGRRRNSVGLHEREELLEYEATGFTSSTLLDGVSSISSRIIITLNV